MVQLKMTTKQLINCHCDSLSQESVSKLVGMIGLITHQERLGIDGEEIKATFKAKCEPVFTNELWIINQFLEHQSKRPLITEALITRWETRTDKL